MPQRSVLLPAQQGPFQTLELLPAGTSPHDVLEQGRLFEVEVGIGGGRLYWKEGSVAGGWENNAVASGLAPGVQVCGDAVLVLPPGAAEASDLQQRLAALAAKHLGGALRRPCSSWAADGSGSQPANTLQGSPAGACSLQPARHKRRQEQQQLLHGLLRRPAGTSAAQCAPGNEAAAAVGAEAAVAAEGTPAVPATPPPAAAAASSAAPGLAGQRWGQAEREAACQRRQQRQMGREQQHEVQVFECEPRSTLLWSIAGRATSLSWQGSAAAGASPFPTSAAPAAAETAAGCVPAAPAGVLSPPPAAAAALPLSPAREPFAEPSPASLDSTPRLPPQLPAKHRSSLDRSGSPWADLQPEMLAVVLAQAGHGADVARTLSQVCPSWRRGLAEERAALQQLRFTCLRWLSGNEGAGGSGGTIGGDDSGVGGSELPWLVQRAVKAGNVAATVAAARYQERRMLLLQGQHGSAAAAAGDSEAAATWYGGRPAHHGRPCGRPEAAAAAATARGSGGRPAGRSSEADVARLWAKAAKLGHPEGQWKIGFASYKGLMGLPRDGEEALLWLTRAAKQLGEVAGSGASRGSSAAAGPGAGGSSGVRLPGRQLPVLMSIADCRHILAQAAHILGYLFLDGEGTRADVGAAIRWFRLAEAHGCRDAGRVLGSLFNSGMYG